MIEVEGPSLYFLSKRSRDAKRTRMYRRPWTSWPRRFLVCRRWRHLFEIFLELDVADAQIVEGSQPHSMAYEEDDLFSTAVDVRAKLHDGTEVIIEIQIRKQQYFLNRFHYYLANQLVEILQNCASKARHIRCTSRWSQSMGLRFWRSRSC